MDWNRRAGNAVLLLILSGGLVMMPVRLVTTDAHTRSVHSASPVSPAVHLPSWRALPAGWTGTGRSRSEASPQGAAGLAPVLQRVLAHDATATRQHAPSPRSGTAQSPEQSWLDQSRSAGLWGGQSPEQSWTQQAEITASAGVGGSEFGWSVALSGNTALVGAPDASRGAVPSAGAAYIFVRSGTTWTQQAMLTASDGAANDYFGASVALSGTTALIGAPYRNGNTGAAYVFVRRGTTWSQQAILTAGNGASGVGWSVALSGDTALVGAAATNSFTGAAYVFVRNGTTWSQQAELIARDGTSYGYFGSAVALSGDTALVGAWGQNNGAGAAYVFARSGSTWLDQSRSAGLRGGRSPEQSWLDRRLPQQAGGQSPEQSWTQQATLTERGGAAGDSFGWSVALDGGTALVGAPNKNNYTGATYVFARSGSTWSQQATLTAADGVANDYFGTSVALSGGIGLVGAPGKNNYTGATYVFARSGSTWSQQATLTDGNGVTQDQFGDAVALSGGTALVGAWNAYGAAGAAYVFVQATNRTFTVNSTVDAPDATPGDGICADSSGRCTLRAAIQEADAQPSGSSITITVPAGTYGLTLGTLRLTANTITISGALSSTTIISGNNTSAVMGISSTVQAAISQVTISGGNAGAGVGGGLLNAGLIVLSNSTLTRNTAYQGGAVANGPLGRLWLVGSTLSGNVATGGGTGGSGGGLSNSGAVTVTTSTFSSNTADIDGGGISNSGALTVTTSTLSGNTAGNLGGGIDNRGILIVTASTLSGNSAPNGGAGINNDHGALTMANTTLSGNATGAGGSGGAIYSLGRAALFYDTIASNSNGIANAGGTVALTGTILANSTAGANCTGTMSEVAGYNLDGGTSCSFNQTTDITNTNPLLGPLANNGGPSRTMALRRGSPAIDHGGTSATGCPATDQRGVPRPDEAKDNGACDIGAYESQGIG